MMAPDTDMAAEFIQVTQIADQSMMTTVPVTRTIRQLAIG